MKRFFYFLRQDFVLLIAALAALGSMLLVPVSVEYLQYFDWQVLALLFCLMAVVAGFQKSGVFAWASSLLCSHANTARQIGLVLVLLCFFSAMFITNDVALITFVPLAILMLAMTEQQKLMPYVIVLQTIAANLGSMLTPVGNPQNLYLYARYQMGVGEFFSTTFPVTAVSLVILITLCMLIPARPLEQHKVQHHPDLNEAFLLLSIGLFLLCLATVFHMVHWSVTLVFVLGCYLIADRTLLKKIDYGLLVTFVCFFIFTGNIAQLAWIQRVLGELLSGRALWVAALSSQMISNVPAAVLLSGFSEQGRVLLLGCNIGGLGTLVASLASLISYKVYSRYPAADRKMYLKIFFSLNCVLLFILLMFAQFMLL